MAIAPVAIAPEAFEAASAAEAEVAAASEVEEEAVGSGIPELYITTID